MQSATVFLLALVAVVAAEGQFYVPRAYYTIDAEGHASPPVPLRRLRRSIGPYPYPNGNSANANAEANSSGGGDANAIAIANAGARAPGGWGLPSFGSYGASNPNLLSCNVMQHKQSGARTTTPRPRRSSNGLGVGRTRNYRLKFHSLTFNAGMTRRQSGPVLGHSVTASSSVGVGRSGEGYYDQYTSVH